MISEGQQEEWQNPSNDENVFENLFPSINFIQSLTGSDVEDEHRLFESSLQNEEEPCCNRNINPVMERKAYLPICNNPFSVSSIEEHADLCLENKSLLRFPEDFPEKFEHQENA